MEDDKIKRKLNDAISDKKNIVIEIYGGCFSETHNVPKGFTYEIVDWDSLEDEMEK